MCVCNSFLLPSPTHLQSGSTLSVVMRDLRSTQLTLALQEKLARNNKKREWEREVGERTQRVSADNAICCWQCLFIWLKMRHACFIIHTHTHTHTIFDEHVWNVFPGNVATLLLAQHLHIFSGFPRIREKFNMFLHFSRHSISTFPQIMVSDDCTHTPKSVNSSLEFLDFRRFFVCIFWRNILRRILCASPNSSLCASLFFSLSRRLPTGNYFWLFAPTKNIENKVE